MKTMSIMDQKEYPEVRQLVETYFEGNKDKVDVWFTTPNPLLGGLAPCTMLALGRGEKLLVWIKNSLEGNHT